MPSGLEGSGRTTKSSKRKRTSPKASSRNRKVFKESPSESLESSNHTMPIVPPSEIPKKKGTATAVTESASVCESKGTASAKEKGSCTKKQVPGSHETGARELQRLQALLESMGSNMSPSSSASGDDRVSASSLEMMNSLGSLFIAESGGITRLVKGLKSADSKVILSSLEELNELLIMSSDDVVYRLPVDEVVPLLFTHLSSGVDVQRMLFAARIISMILDSGTPQQLRKIPSLPNVRIVSEHVLNIQMVELSDQCVVILSRWSKLTPSMLILGDCLGNVLRNMEIFCVATQHQCMQIVEDLLGSGCEIPSEVLPPVVARLGSLLSHPDVMIVGRVATCWRMAVDLVGTCDAPEMAVAVVEFLIANVCKGSSRLLNGLGALASKSNAIAAYLASDNAFVDFCKTALTDRTLTRSVLALYSAILPAIAFNEDHVLELDAIRASVIPPIYFRETLDSALKAVESTMGSFGLHFALLAGFTDAPWPVHSVLPVVERTLAAAASAVAASAPIPDPAHVLASVALVEIAGSMPIARYGIRESLQKLKGPCRLGKTVTWKALIARDANLCLKSLPKFEIPLSPVVSVKDLLKPAIYTLHELRTKEILPKLDLWITTDLAAVKDALCSSPRYTQYLVSSLVAAVEEELLTDNVLSMVDSVDSVNCVFGDLLSRPIRIALETSGQPALQVMVEPFATVGSLNDFLRSRVCVEEDIETGGMYGMEDEEGEEGIFPHLDDMDEEEGVDISDLTDDFVFQPHFESSSRPSGGEQIVIFRNGQVLDPNLTLLEVFATNSLTPIGPAPSLPAGKLRLIPNQSAPCASSLTVASLLKPAEATPSSSLVKAVWGASHSLTYASVPTMALTGAQEASSVALWTVCKSLEFLAKRIAHLQTRCGSQLLKLIGSIAILSPNSNLVSLRLSEVVERMLASPILLATKQYPSWILQVGELCPALLSEEALRGLFSARFLGMHRSVTARLGSGEKSAVAVVRQKIKLRRDKIIPSAILIMNTYGKAGSGSPCPILEMEFQEEEGTGSGPTSEFYSLVSEALKQEPGMFRKTVDGSLFPEIVAGAAPSAVLEKWRLMGFLVGRALLDSRLLSLEFSPIFWMLVTCDLVNEEWLGLVDPALAHSLELMRGMSDAEMREAHLDAAVMPGCEGIGFYKKKSVQLSRANLDRFIKNVTHTVLSSGIQAQLRAFREAFAEVLPLESLSMWQKMGAISGLLNGAPASFADHWTIPHLTAHINAAHGYTPTSESFQNFISILTQLTEDERVEFIKFVTGSRALPHGGFAGLKPGLTVVKVTKSAEEGPVDSFLPSVMTCANFVKLPQYSCKQVMKSQLIKAIREGQGSFLLS